MERSELGALLAAHGVGKYASKFEEEEVDLQQMSTLTLDDLRDMGIPLGPRKKIIELFATGVATSVRPPTPPPSQMILLPRELRGIALLIGFLRARMSRSRSP